MPTWFSQLPRDAVAPAAARSMVRAHEQALGQHALDVVLVVSELVTNAVRHGGEPIGVALTIEGRRVRLQVTDGGSHGRPALRASGENGGYGLHLVQALSTRWGLGAHTHDVWFEIDLDTALRQAGTDEVPRAPDGYPDRRTG